MGQFSMEILGCAGSVLSGNQQAVYAGFPAALNGLFAAKEVFAVRLPVQKEKMGHSDHATTSNPN